MRNTPFLILCLLALSHLSLANDSFDQLLEELDNEIARKELYVQEKEGRIASLKSLLEDTKGNYDLQQEIYGRIFREYQSFIYDSALHYANLAAQASRNSARPEQVDMARLNYSFAMASAGIFKEALDTLDDIHYQAFSDSLQAEYFDLKARCWFERAEYIQDRHYTPIYRQNGWGMLDSAYAKAPAGSIIKRLLKAGKLMSQDQPKKAIEIYEAILDEPGLTHHQVAVTATLLSTAYYWDNRPDDGLKILTKAAIADIKGAVKETVASRLLAQGLFEKGQLDKAKFYINESLADAEFYGARFRRSQLAQIAPLIEAQHAEAMARESAALKQYNTISTLFFLVVLGFGIWSFIQFRKLKKARADLDASYSALKASSAELSEVSEIKDEYIGQFFDVISDYIEKIKKFKLAVSKKAMDKNLDEVLYVVDKINLKKERESLNLSFDQTFLKIYPNFVAEWNKLMSPEFQFKYEPDQPLSPEIRIFALIKLGITDHDKIAKILDYSVNTIYAYKTKVKNNALVPKAAFEDEILAIGK